MKSQSKYPNDDQEQTVEPIEDRKPSKPSDWENYLSAGDDKELSVYRPL